VNRQIEHAKANAQQKGWTLDDGLVFVDDGISGAEFATGLLCLINALKPRPAFQVLIMSAQSGLGREMTQTMGALGEIVRAGVRVFYYMDGREERSIRPSRSDPDDGILQRRAEAREGAAAHV
jgi:hypothetical protein